MYSYKINTLSHSGVLGQKWGIRRAEWYPIDKYREHLKNLGYDEKTINKKMKKAERGEAKYKKQVAKTRAKNLTKAQEARKANINAKNEENQNKKTKEELIKSGDIKEINKNVQDYTNEEINEAMTRHNTVKNLSNEVSKSYPQAEKTVQKFMKDVGEETLKTVAKNTAVSVGYMLAKKAVEKTLIKMGKEDAYKNIEWKKLNK